jgi:hypothetical protein
MNRRFSWLRGAAAVCVAASALVAGPAHAGLFDDNQARQAILDLRAKTDDLASQVAAAQRALLDQNNSPERSDEV